jgi:hypothetical protein
LTPSANIRLLDRQAIEHSTVSVADPDCLLLRVRPHPEAQHLLQARAAHDVRIRGRGAGDEGAELAEVVGELNPDIVGNGSEVLLDALLTG